MGEPVLVVHGVANRDLSQFQRLVGDLQGRLKQRFELVPVFWGDLGARTVGIGDTIPDLGASRVRGDFEEPLDPAVSLALVSRQEATGRTRSIDAIAALIADALFQEMDGGEERVRTTSDVEKAIREELPETVYLRNIDSPRVLEAVGKSIAAGMLAGSEDGPEGAREVRVESTGDRGFIGRLLRQADKLIGAVLGEAFGTFNHYLRAALVPNLAEAIGDVFVYEHLRLEIQNRIWNAVDSNPSTRGWGTQDKPIHVVAHSLGGVISFQAATSSQGGRRLYMNGFVTFGSQAPFFHVLDPKGSSLSPYDPGTPVEIQDSIRKWTNLWEPLDPLAFIASKVFVIGPATLRRPPVDTPTRHLASSGLWTHSSYWSSDDLVEAIQTTLGS